MRKAICFVAATGLVALPALARPQEPAPSPSPTPPARRVEARADEELKKMAEFLARTPRFALEAEETFTEIEAGEPKVELTNVRRVAVERPKRVATDAAGDTMNRAAWYDGRSVTVLDKEHNVYATVEGAATIDATLDKLEDEYGVVLPFVDLFYSDPYADLMEGVTYGRYLGLHLGAGVLCHHLVFAQETIEWQIWIDAGAQPLPRKFVITYVQEPGEPQYSAVVRRWVLNPTFPESLFTFEAPEGATKIDAKAIVRRPNEGDKPREGGDAKGGR
jgi:hypothetical protein